MEYTVVPRMEQIQANDGNDKCFECSSSPALWASVNNGIFLCSDCAQIHRSFGITISFVRSTSMDSWDTTQLRMMQEGGNTKLLAYFQSYQIPINDSTIISKYKTKASYFYRAYVEVLKYKLKGKLLSGPSFNEGKEIVEYPGVLTIVIEGTEEDGQNQDQSDNYDKYMNMVGKAFNGTVYATTNFAKTVNEKYHDPNLDLKAEAKNIGTKIYTGTKSAATQVSDKVKDPEFQANVKQFGQNVYTGTKTAAIQITEKVKDPEFQAGVKQFGKDVYTGVTNVASKIGEKVKDPEFQAGVKQAGQKVADGAKNIWINRDEYLSKAAEVTKSGWTQIKGFFSNDSSNPPRPGGQDSNAYYQRMQEKQSIQHDIRD